MSERIGEFSPALLVVLLFLLSSTTTSMAAGAAAPDPTADRVTLRAESEVTNTQLSDNSTPIRHRDPSELDDPGELSQIQEWLSRHLADQLRESTLELRQEEYERARSLVGEDYRSLLRKYIDVAGETRENNDDATGREFEEAQSNQRALSESLESYRDTRSEYREARENGNETRARAIARRLERETQRITRTGSALRESYQNIANGTGVNLTRSQRTITAIVAEVNAEQAERREAIFVSTQVQAQTRSTNVSFRSPLRVTGKVLTENGTRLPGKTVRLQIAERTLTTRTNSSGMFTFSYRPTLLPVETDTVTIQFVPKNTSAYLPSQTGLSIEIRQITPTLTVKTRPATGGFSDEITVTGRLLVNETGVPGEPIDISFANRPIGTERTDDNGRISRVFTVPPDVPLGERDVAAAFDVRGRALGHSEATTAVTVVNSSTLLSVSGSQNSDRSIRASGRLLTENGMGVPGQSIALRIGGETIRRTTTTTDGSYATTVRVPGEHLADEEGNVTIPLVAVYTATGTNLDPSRDDTSITLSLSNESPSMVANGGGGNPIAGNDPSPLHWAAVAIIGAAITGGMGFAYSRGYLGPVIAPFGKLRHIVSSGRNVMARLPRGTFLQATDEQQHAPGDPRDSSVQQPTSDAEGERNDVHGDTGQKKAESPQAVSLLESARESQSISEARSAIAEAYASARRELSVKTGLDSSLTHREFLRATRSQDLEKDRVRAFARLTEIYERAAFTDARVTPRDAEEAIDLAETLLEGGNRSSGRP